MSQVPDMLQEFDEVASLLLEQCADLRDYLPRDIAAIVAARDAAEARLTAARNGSTLSESRAIYELPLERLAQFPKQLEGLSGRIDSIVRETMACAEALRNEFGVMSRAIEAIDGDRKLSAEQQRLVAEWRSAVAFGSPMWKFFSALPMIGLLDWLWTFRDVNLIFLGEAPGKRFDLQAVTEPAAGFVRNNMIDLATFPGASLLWRTCKAATTKPQKRAILDLHAATSQIERVMKLSSSLDHLNDHATHLGEVLSITESAVKESIERIDHLSANVAVMLKAASSPRDTGAT